IAVFDPFAAGERAGAEALGVQWCGTLEDVRSFSPDWVVIATPHDTAAQLCPHVLDWGVNVLIEKPFGRSLAEAEQLAARETRERQLFVGFNYRFFPGIVTALGDARAGLFGPVVSVNLVLGHGGSPGMEKGWKFDLIKAGGGCLIDPGVHLLDLCHCLEPKLAVENLQSWSGFWKTGIEEETHLLLRGGTTVFNLQVSIIRWRSVFRLEVHGTEGYGVVTGRGRSYGPMRYVRGRRWGWQTAANQEASEETVSVSECDDSFVDELRALLNGAGGGWPAPCTAGEALEVMRTYETARARL
ncbi:MAG TPA: Gfo/Idh/MocA family oxidoreductase, partial [Chthoniobacteraceae bacterium]|nr:Gfo/Idh/MocA family oxidoreductase [Chthoniobacteraceae bacterium]